MGVRYSIRRKLTIALVIILLSFFTMNAINYYHSINTLTRKLTDGRLKVLNETAQSVRQLFSGIEARASEIRFNVNVQKVLSEDFSASGYEGYTAMIQAQKVLQSITFSWEPIKSIYVVPEQVQVRNKSTTSGFLNRDSASIPSLYQEMDSLRTESGWFPTRISEGQDEQAENIYTYVQPVTNLYDSKEVMGHVLMNLKETSLYQILRNNSMDDNSQILLLDETYRVFYDSSRAYQSPLSKEYTPDALQMEGASGSYLTGKGSEKQLVTGPMSILWTKKVERLCHFF